MSEKKFTLYDLRVEVIEPRGKMVCDHKVGDYFDVIGGNLSFPGGQIFGLYALAALLPLLPAKQRMLDPNDWMATDDAVACPDPLCGALFRITRTKKSTFNHADVSAVVVENKEEGGEG